MSGSSLERYEKLDIQTSSTTTDSIPDWSANRRHQIVSNKYVPHKRFSRYGDTVKNFKPYRKSAEPSIDKAGLFSFLSCNWVKYYLWSSFNKEQFEMPKCSPNYSCEVNARRLKGLCSDEIVRAGRPGASMARIAWKFISTRVLFAVLFYTIGVIFTLLGPGLFFGRIVEFLQNKIVIKTKFLENLSTTISVEETTTDDVMNNNFDTTDNISNASLHTIIEFDYTGIGYVFGFILTELMAILFYSISISISLGSAAKLRSAVLASAYKKIVDSSNINDVPAYQLLGFLGGDGRALFDLAFGVPLLITTPIMFIGCSVLIFYFTNVAGLAAFIIVLIYYPLLYFFNYLTKNCSEKINFYTKRRLIIFDKLISNMVLLKMTLWDRLLMDNMKTVRNKELKHLKQSYFIGYFGYSLLQTQPLINVSALLIIAVCTDSLNKGNTDDFDRAKILPAFIILMILLKQMLDNFWIGINNLRKSSTSLDKLKHIFLLYDTNIKKIKNSDKDSALTITNGSFTWKKETVKKPVTKVSRFSFMNREIKQEDFIDDYSTFNLTELSFDIKKGALIGICGPQGSGKTSLLLAILNHMNKISGDIEINGSVTYVSQTPWLFNGSIRDNILFGEYFEHQKYYSALECCAIHEELYTLSAGDNSLIETTPLSLAQKQCLTLSRAVYSNKDIYLLDNPLSALDCSKNMNIFERCILQALKGRTILLVTDKIKFLNQCDYIFVMDNGAIVEEGTHEEMIVKNRRYTKLIKSFMKQNTKAYFGESMNIYGGNNEGLASIRDRSRDNSINEVDGDRLSLDAINEIISEDEQDANQDNILHKESVNPKHTLCSYLKKAGICLIIIFSILLFINAGMISAISMMFLSTLYKYTWFGIADEYTKLVIVSTFVVSMIITGFISSVIYIKATFNAAKRYHNIWIRNICSASLEYFQKTLMNQLINIFSVNLYCIDSEIPEMLYPLLHNLFIIIFTAAIIVLVSTWFIIPLLIYFIMCGTLHIFVSPALYRLHEQEMDLHSPLCNLIINTVPGRAVIQAFRRNSQFTKKFYEICDRNSMYITTITGIKYYVNFSINFLSVCFLLAMGMCIALMPEITSGWGSLGFIATLQLIIATQRASLHRIDLYGAMRMLSLTHSQMTGMDPEGDNQVYIYPKDWPKNNYSIKFEHVKLRLHCNMPFILNDMSFYIKSGEKIGIVGKTDTTKRGIIAAIYRLSETSGGRIMIGGIDIATLPLHTLRYTIGIVPQEPFVLQGSIRDNLDPMAHFTEERLLEALHNVNLQHIISSFPKLIDEPIESLTDIGHRQLLHLARNWLNNVKILVIEECMSDIGNVAEEIIHKSVKTLFSRATVLLVGHRFESVEYCDRVMVVEDGKIIELDEPENLQKIKSSQYYKLMSESTENVFQLDV